MDKTETVEIQKEFSKRGGKLTKYMELILGEKGVFRLMKYEFIIGIASQTPGALGLLLRSKLYPKLLGSVGGNVQFGIGVVLRHPRKIHIGNDVVIDDHCVLDAKGQNNRGIFIGDGVFIGRNTILNCKNGDIILEDRVNIGFNCMIFSASEVRVGASALMAAYCYLVGGTHHFDNPSIPVLDQGRSSQGIQLGPGGWLGAHVTIFDGVTIGKHVIVGAGSVVNKMLPDYVIAAGAPVRIIQKRQPDDQESSKTDQTTKVKNPKKKMLYLSMYDPHVPYTGAGVRGAQFVNYLSKYYTLDLIYMKGSGHPGHPDLEKKFADQIRNVREKIAIPFSQKGYFIFSKALYRTAVSFLEKNHYDFILADYGLSARYGIKLSKKFNVPWIYNSHNVEYKQYLGKAKKDFRRWPLVPYVHRIEKRGCQLSDILIAVSDPDAEFFSKWTFRDKIVVVPQGFDETAYHPFYKPSKNDIKTILFFGNYNISTNREAVLVTFERIVDKVVRNIPNVKFQFVGANPPKEYTHPNIEFTGFVESVVPYIQKADLVISPILKGWGMPTKVIESLACGKSVIATETGARTVPRHYQRLEICTIDQFPEKICQILKLDHPVDACDFEALKKDYLWENRLDKFREKIEETIKSENINQA